MEEAVASPESLVDPDAVNITREFIDFTEFLPADMYRSLQLVRQLKKKAADHSRNVDSLCKEFASLPEQSRVLPPSLDVPLTDYVCPPMSERETELRIRISNAIKDAQFARQEAKAEAERASQNINRHHARIVAIYGGLCKVIIPPDEPEQKPVERQQTDVRKIKIRISSQKATPAGRHPRLRGSTSIAQTSRSRQKQRERNNRDDDGDDNEWEDIPSTPYSYEKKKKKKLLGGISRRGQKNNSESPFVGGAKARNEDGSLIPNSLLPWNRLTNEELAKLRKRMKKNSGWTPSVTMIIRELETLGRGPKHKEKYEDQWGGSRGDEFLKIYGPEDGGIGDPEKIAPDDGAGVRENKGMKLNRAKKRKREEERKEKEKEREREKLEAKIEEEEEEEKLRSRLEEAKMKREAQEEKERAERAELAKREREKAKAEEEAAAAAAAASAKEKRERENAEIEERARASAALKEQERAAAAAAAASEARVPQPITRSSSISSAASSSTSSESSSSGEDLDSEMPDAILEEPIPSPPTPAPPPPPPKPRLGRPPKNSKPPKPPSSDSPPSSGEKRKRALSAVTAILPTPSLAESRAKRGASVAAPPTGTVSLAVGRKRSNVAGPKPSKPTKPGVGRKKGLVAGNSRRRVDVQDADGAGEWVDEEDEDLKTYCLCDEVSHGFMVQCDNEQCSKKWFHIDCVGLTEQVAKDSSLQWFCPDCDSGGGRGKRRKKT